MSTRRACADYLCVVVLVGGGDGDGGALEGWITDKPSIVGSARRPPICGTTWCDEPHEGVPLLVPLRVVHEIERDYNI